MENDDIVTRAQERFEIAKQGWDDIYQKASDDLRFLSDEPNAMWDTKLLEDRKNRPVYTVDQLSQFVHQVENDERMNTPSIDIIPDDEGSDVETAEQWQGIIRGIEYNSNADAAYDTAGSFAIRSSIGFIRVDTEFVKGSSKTLDASTFLQQLVIKRVINPRSIYIDPNSIEPDGSDAMWAFVLEELSVKEFQKLYPNKAVSDWSEKKTTALQDQDKITIAEYFEIIEETSEYGLLETGEVQIKDKDGIYKTTRKVSERKVKRCKLSGTEELESTTFPGEYIPIVPVYGEEAWADGKRNLKSLIRNGKSPQQMFNLGISLDVEMLMKQPQASFMAAAGQVSGFEHEYADPAKANVLHYNVEDVDGNKMPPPQRVNPPQSSTGFVNLSRESLDNIKGSIGMYNASIGQKSNETSGVAIQRRNQESDVGNFHFGDNLKRSVTQVGKIIVSAGKIVYDTPRVINSIDKEDNAKMIGINGKRVAGQERDYHINQGSFGVRVTTGPSYTTQRQESAEFYQNTLKILPPEIATQVLDLVFKYQDAPGSQALAARFKKMVNPALLSDDEKDKDAPDPQVQQLTQQVQQVTQAAQQQIQQLTQELSDKKAELAIKEQEAQAKQMDSDTKRMEAKAKIIQAIQPQKDEKPSELPPIHPDEPIEVLYARLQHKLTTQQQADVDAQANSQRETQEAESKQALVVENLKNTQALIQGVGGIQQLLNSLVEQTAVQTQAIVQQTQVMDKPMEVIRDEQGNFIGAK